MIKLEYLIEALKWHNYQYNERMGVCIDMHIYIYIYIRILYHETPALIKATPLSSIGNSNAQSRFCRRRAVLFFHLLSPSLSLSLSVLRHNSNSSPAPNMVWALSQFSASLYVYVNSWRFNGVNFGFFAVGLLANSPPGMAIGAVVGEVLQRLHSARGR